MKSVKRFMNKILCNAFKDDVSNSPLLPEAQHAIQIVPPENKIPEFDSQYYQRINVLYKAQLRSIIQANCEQFRNSLLCFIDEDMKLESSKPEFLPRIDYQPEIATLLQKLSSEDRDRIAEIQNAKVAAVEKLFIKEIGTYKFDLDDIIEPKIDRIEKQIVDVNIKLKRITSSKV